MVCSSFRISFGGVAVVAACLSVQTLRAEESSSTKEQTKNHARMNCGAQIECVTPDGRSGQVSRLPAQDPEATALIMDDDTITCLLQEGETNFVIELPENALLDRFTFLNENAGARGELRIAVSNQRLAANSPDWTKVEGIVPFARKRLFGVSLLGIEAKFVRLSFHVEKQRRVDARAAYSQKSDDIPADREISFAQQHFHNSGLESALNSKFAMMHGRASTLLLTCNSPSVAPLPPTPRP